MRRLAWSFLIPIAVYLLGTISFLSSREQFQSFPLDDAWIHQVYARAFATGQGFEYNAGEQEAGATSPLWVIVTSPVHWFASGDSRGVVAGVMVVGLLFGVISILLFWSIVRRMTDSPAVACVAAALLALEPRLLFSSLSGMETTLLFALWLGGLLAALTRRWFTSATLFALTAITRPESLVVLPVCAIVLFASNREWPRQRKLLTILVLGVPMVAWGLFCHATTGHWLPNTYYIKAHRFGLTQAALANAWHIVSGSGFGTLLLFPIGILVCIGCLAWRRRWLELAILVGAPVIYLAGVAGTRELSADGYYWTRWLDPASLLLTAAFSLGFALVLSGAKMSSPPRGIATRWWGIGVMTAGALALVLSAPRFTRSFAERRNHLRTDSRAINTMNVRAGLWIRDHTPADAIVGVNDAGAIRYFGERHTIDLLGINNQELAFSRLRLTDALLQCDWLAIFPVAFRKQADLILQEYSIATTIRVPVEEYTVCDCPLQTTIGIFKKK